MNQIHLTQAQRAVERFFYKVRVNIALYNILSSKKHSEFKKEIKGALEKQILYFAKIEKVKQILEITKASEKENDIRDKVLLLFPFLTSLIKDDSFIKHLEFANMKGGTSAYNMLNVDKQYELPKGLENKLRRHIERVVQGIDNTTQTWIINSITRGLMTGATPEEIAKKLRDDARKVAEQRAEIIAEQEAAEELANAQALVFEREGVQYKRLVTSRDERVCIICVGDENVGIIPANQVFPSGRSKTPIHISCRCFVLPIMPTINNG